MMARRSTSTGPAFAPVPRLNSMSALYPETDRLLGRRKVTFTDGMADKFALFLIRVFQF